MNFEILKYILTLFFQMRIPIFIVNYLKDNLLKIFMGVATYLILNSIEEFLSY